MSQKAYSYIRFSSPEQAKGRSLSRQQEACEAYCRAHGLALATDREYTFLDAGASGFKGEHLGAKGQLARFLRLVEDGTIERGSTLIVESLDRLSRQDVKTALQQFLNLTAAGIRIVTLSDGAVYDEHLEVQDLLMSIFVMSRAHEESSTKSIRVREAIGKKQELARSERKPMGRMAPLWLRLENGRYVEDAARVAIVRQVFEWALSGRGKAQIARMLNQAGVPSFKGTTWGASSVDKLLKNRAVLGEYQPRSIQGSSTGAPVDSGEPISDYFPSVIDTVTFHAAADAVRSRRIARATKQTSEFNVWQGVAKCVHCGYAMHLVNKGRPPKGYRYLHCSLARKALCNGRAIRYEPLEGVFRLMVARLDSAALIKANASKLRREMAAVDDQLAAERAVQAKLTKALQTDPSSALIAAARAVDARVADLATKQRVFQGELATESGMSFEEFTARLDEHLQDFAGRDRANALVKRLNVVAYMDRDLGTIVTQDGRVLFGVQAKDGTVGYMDPDIWHRLKAEDGLAGIRESLQRMQTGFRKIKPMHAGPLAFAAEADLDQAMYDAIESEGHPAGEY